MKEQFLAIADQLRAGEITTNVAIAKVKEMGGVLHNGVSYTGKAKVKENTDWIYAGHTLPIIGVYCIHNHERSSAFPRGSKSYRLSLEGTEFKYKETVIHEKDLEILELEMVDLNKEEQRMGDSNPRE